jgi:hypothetical protein
MKRLVLPVLIGVVLSGCATVPKQSFNAAANTHVKKVAVIAPQSVENIAVDMVSHPGTSFGLVGGLVAAADMHAKTSSYNNALGSAKTDWKSFSQQQVADELKKKGYEVETVDIRKKTDTDYLSSYPSTMADAFLDYQLRVAQLAAGPTSNYIPTTSMKVRLVDAKNQKILYEEALVSGLSSDASNQTISLSPANPQGYKDIAELTAHAQESTAALKQGIQQMAQRIASDLKK